MNSLTINNLLIDRSIQNKGSIICEVNNYLVLLGVKTSIYFGDSIEAISVNNVKLSKKTSMKLKYLLGSLNFFNEVLCKKLFVDATNHHLLMKNINILLALVYKLENEKSIVFLEEIIDEMNMRRIDLRNEFCTGIPQRENKII